MPESNSLVNIGNLAEPATRLIEKIYDALGGIFKPFQIIRVARAEAEAAIIGAEADIKINEMTRRAIHRFVAEETQRQENIEGIVKKSIPLVSDTAKPQDIENDWIVNFFDKCRTVTDHEMQQLWSHVLAGESNAPGSFSRRTVNLISDLDKRDAVLFQSLCRFCWTIDRVNALVFDTDDELYKQYGINFDSLSHLESLGLIQFGTLTGFILDGLPREVSVYYYGETFRLTMPKSEKNRLAVGHVMLTKAGMELSPICGSAAIPDFIEYVQQHWLKNGVISMISAKQVDSSDAQH